MRIPQKSNLPARQAQSQAVREQMLLKVMPQVGVFLSKTSQAQQQDASVPSKAF